jgi:hypothetical protein
VKVLVIQRVLAGFLIVLVMLTACSAGGGSDMKPTLTEDQARAKVEEYIQSTVGLLPPIAHREMFSRNRSECTDPTDSGPTGRFEISATYEIQGLDPAQYPDHFIAIAGWWATHGFEVLKDERPSAQYMFVRNTADSFDMSLEANQLGKLYLGATSPCVWPNGTPPAQANEPIDSEQDNRDATVALDHPLSSVPQKESAKVRPRRPRRAPAEETEDFDQTDWTSES